MIVQKPHHYHSEKLSGKDRWLVSFSDFMTLMFAFFVVMYSISQVNESKYRVLSETLSNSFESKHQSDIESDPESDAFQLVDSNSELKSSGTAHADSQKYLSLHDLSQELYSVLNKHSGEEFANIGGNETRLEVNLDADILFASGSSEPSYLAEFVFEEVSRILKQGNNRIEIEGHTDDLAINTLQFPSNWQLSSARASSIVQLLEGFGVDRSRLSATGYSDTRPIAGNNSLEGRAQNRRVVLVVHGQSVEIPTLSSIEHIPTEAALDKEDLGEIKFDKSEAQPQLPVLHEDLQAIPMQHGGLLITNESREALQARRKDAVPEKKSRPVGEESKPVQRLPQLELDQ